MSDRLSRREKRFVKAYNRWGNLRVAVREAGYAVGKTGTVAAMDRLAAKIMKKVRVQSATRAKRRMMALPDWRIEAGVIAASIAQSELGQDEWKKRLEEILKFDVMLYRQWSKYCNTKDKKALRILILRLLYAGKEE